MTKEEIRKLALTYGFKTCPQANGSEDLDANVYRFARVVAYRARNPVSGIDELVTRLFGAEGLDDLPAVTTPQRKFFLYGYTTALVDFATGGRASRPVKKEAFRLPPKILDLPTSPSCKGWWGGTKSQSMMQGYRNLPGRYDVLPKAKRKRLWGFLFHGQAAILQLQHYRQILVWFQLWRRGQALIPMLEPRIISLAMERVLAALEEGGAA